MFNDFELSKSCTLFFNYSDISAVAISTDVLFLCFSIQAGTLSLNHI